MITEDYIFLMGVASLFSAVVFFAMLDYKYWLFQNPVTLGKILMILLLTVFAIGSLPIFILLGLVIALVYLVEKILTFPLIK